MALMNNSLYRKDVLAALKTVDLGFLRGKSILITGATGLICSAIVDLLLENNAVNGAQTRIYAAARSGEKVTERFGTDPMLEWTPYDALKPVDFAGHADFVVHGAGNASPELFVKQAAETMLMNFQGLREWLEYARRSGARVLYVSSSEIYGKKETEDPFNETDPGYIRHLDPRASYAMSKRASETLCSAYLSEYGVDPVIVRPGHIFGPTASEKDRRISSDFAFKAARGEDLSMMSAGLQKRSYMYCVDCAAAMLTVLDKGVSGEAYNICGGDVTTIREMAQALADAGGVTLSYKEPSPEELAAFNPMNNSSLSFEKLSRLGYRPAFTAKEGLKHTVEILRSC